ncbi:MAG TPA: hypothetical protein PKC67_13100 [Kiritimatiellia bacterium]|nr:hypothetical protein [Kiritimatiellia bacterium]HMP35274.1 hypothetical protein [Kiritimatiellia bacterium]
MMVALLLALGSVRPVDAQPGGITAIVPGTCRELAFPSGARGLYCVPERGWNGDVVVFSHGYRAITETIDYQNLTLGSLYLPDVVQQLGFAFATTTYRQNGLAILEGVEDIRQLVLAFPRATGRRAHRFILAGASQGGMVTTLALERYPSLFAGGLALCGPIGNFTFQTDTISHFRVLFDYFFPGVLPGSAVSVPPSMLEDWHAIHRPAVLAALQAEPARWIEWMNVARAAYVPEDPSTWENTAMALLWYHTFTTADGQAKLGGNPFDNRRTVYRGSADDVALNAGVGRFAADATARWASRPYNTSGVLRRPLVVLHTTGDEIVPFAHAPVYAWKNRATGSFPVTIYPIVRYGHCTFTAGEIISGLMVLLQQLR